MARVLNLIRRSEAEYVIEEEVQPGQWLTATHVPQAPTSPEKPAQRFASAQDVMQFLGGLGSFFKRKPTTVSPFKLRPPGVGPPPAMFQEPEPPAAPLVQGPLPRQAPVGVTPEQITRLVTETKIREQQIKNYLATPLGYVWQESKKLPGVVVRVPVKRPAPPPGEIEAMFPRPHIPTPQEQAGFGPEPVRVFKGWLQVEGQPRINVWEDFAGNEVPGYRSEPGEFGQVEQILEY